jgi:hypothetical protein
VRTAGAGRAARTSATTASTTAAARRAACTGDRGRRNRIRRCSPAAAVAGRQREKLWTAPSAVDGAGAGRQSAAFAALPDAAAGAGVDDDVEELSFFVDDEPLAEELSDAVAALRLSFR